MMRSMFAAISGLKAHQVMLDVTAADIANVNTVGYKGSRMTFRDSLSQCRAACNAADAQGFCGRSADGHARVERDYGILEHHHGGGPR